MELFRVFRLYCTHYHSVSSKNRTIIVIFYYFLYTKFYHNFQSIQFNPLTCTLFHLSVLSPFSFSFSCSLSILQFCQIHWQKKRKHTSRTWFHQDKIASISLYFSTSSSSLGKAIDSKLSDRKLSLFSSLFIYIILYDMNDTKMRMRLSENPH